MKQAKTLAELRDAKGLSQAQVAKILEITPQGYGAIERGERGLKAGYIKKLAELFKVSADRIISIAINNNAKLSDKTGTES